MKNPPAFDEPDRMRSPLYTEDIDEITREQTDSGGVHTNSGVSNKAASLMADGGTFNGRTIRGLGLIKTGRIYYETNTNLLTSGSDYMDLYDALQQACANLIGTAGITVSDCAEVKKVVDATEMNLQPLAVEARAVEAPMCDTGLVPTDLFFDNMENTTSGNWIKQAPVVGDNHFYYPQNSHTIPDVDTTYTTSGRYNIWGDNAGVDFLEDGFDPKEADFSIAMSKSVAVPAGAFMRFNHAYGFEDFVVPNITEMYMDGGVVEYSTNNGTTWTDGKALFANNGYNGKIQGDNLNPLSGRSAFVGQSHGYYSSRLNLAALAGKSVRFRYRMGIDAFGGDYGWFIDDVRIYTCAAPQGGPSGNLLRNPGFEIDANNDTRPDGWTPINAAVTRSNTVKHGGTYSMRHSTTTDATYKLTQIVGNIPGGAPYAFSGWVNVPTTSDQFGFTFNVAWYSAAGKLISTSAVKSYSAHTGGVWNRASAQLSAPAGTMTAVVQMSVAGLKGTVYVDDLFFGNMVANGGFEQDVNSDNTPDGWSRNVSALRTTDVSRSGRYGLRHNASDNSSYIVEQNVKGIAAGQSYTLGAAVNIPQTTDAFTFRFMVRWRNAATGIISVSTVRAYTSHTGGAWRPMSATVRPPAGATSADVQMVVDSLNGTVLIDDVSLQP